MTCATARRVTVATGVNLNVVRYDHGQWRAESRDGTSSTPLPTAAAARVVARLARRGAVIAWGADPTFDTLVRRELAVDQQQR